MKKSIKIIIILVGIIIINLHFVSYAAAQKEGAVSKPIPTDVMAFVKRSCGSCHSEPGNMMAIAHLNLTKWDTFSPKKQADKADDMCTMITKDKMPPRKFRENHADVIPAKDEMQMVCDWALSLQAIRK